jgi:hypothetical protein
VELFAGLEANSFAWSDRDFGTGSGIATNTCLPRLNGEDAEPAKFNAVSGNQVLLHAIEDGVYRSLCFCPWQTGTLNNPLYKILLNHSGPPSLGCNFLF